MNVRAMYVAGVVVSALVWIALALTVHPTGESGAPLRLEQGWQPAAGFVVVWALGFVALAIAWRQPLVGLFVLCVFEYALPRYSTEYQFMLQLWLPEVTAGLTAAGWLVWRRQLVYRWPSGAPVVTLLLAALVTWVAVSAIAITLSGEAWQPERTQRPSRFLVAAVAFVVAAHAVRSSTVITSAAFGLAACLLARALARPGAVTLDNDLSALVAVVAPLALFPVLTGRLGVQLLALATTCGLLGVMALTRNRGGLVGLGVAALGVVILARSWKVRAIGVVAVTAAMALPLTVDQYRDRFVQLWTGGMKSGSAGERLVLWDAAGRMVREHPLTGVGPGHFATKVHTYNPTLGQLGAHNTVIAMFAETGIVGGTLFVLLFTSGLAMAARTSWFGEGWQATAAMAVGASILGYVGAGMFMGRQTQVVAYALLGAVVALRSRYSNEP